VAGGRGLSRCIGVGGTLAFLVGGGIRRRRRNNLTGDCGAARRGVAAKLSAS